jgi:para-nitrobenzyl esterase
MVALALITACGSPGPEVPSPIVVLSPETPVAVTGGQVQGSVSDDNPDVMAFKGIPFAAPPVGELRWRPPEPVVAWEGVRDATTPGSICMQGASEGQSEDCLFLNVWAAREPMERRPVMVWIHGGGFVIGSGSSPLFDGTRLASRGVVVVTLSYRLGAFGFMAHPLLSAESAHDSSGNYGLLDMVAALEWVRDNAAAFGGDPERVTIFGESAGAGAVMSVMLMPQSRGLFHRAIAESSFINGWDRRLRESFGDSPSVESQGIAVAEAMGATGDDALLTMRAVTPAEVFTAVNAVLPDLMTAGSSGFGWAPNVDGWVFPDDPILMYANGQQHQVPLITGINGNEGSLMTGQMPMDNVEAFETYVRNTYPSVAEQALALYAVSSPEEAKPGVDHIFHDMWFAGPLRTLATSHAKTAPVWLYHFTLVPPTAMGSSLGSHHAAEIFYVFGNLIDRSSVPEGSPPNPMNVGDWTETDRRVTAAMMDHWVQFASTGNPNRDGLIEWPEFDEVDQHLTFGDPIQVDTGLHVAGSELYDAYQANRRQISATEMH